VLASWLLIHPDAAASMARPGVDSGCGKSAKVCNDSEVIWKIPD